MYYILVILVLIDNKYANDISTEERKPTEF